MTNQFIYLFIYFLFYIAEQLLWLWRRLRRCKNRIGSRYTDTSGSRFVPSTYVLHTVVKTSNTRDVAWSLDRSVKGLVSLRMCTCYLAPQRNHPKKTLTFSCSVIYIYILFFLFFILLSTTHFLFRLLTFNSFSFIFFILNNGSHIYVRQPKILTIK